MHCHCQDIQCSFHPSSIYHAVLIYTHSFIIVPPRRTFVVIQKFFSKNGNVKPWIISFLFCVLNTHTQKKKSFCFKNILLFTVHTLVSVIPSWLPLLYLFRLNSCFYWFVFTLFLFRLFLGEDFVCFCLFICLQFTHVTFTILLCCI